MDVGLTGIWVENPLQHNSARPHELGEKSDPIQEQRVQHGSIAKHNAQINRRMQENVDKRGDEGERGRRRKKKRVASSPVSQVKG